MLRILCLHGYHGSAEILRAQLRPLTSALDAPAEFVCVDAPSLTAGDFGWWHATCDGERRAHYRGWSATRDWLRALCASDGPFDGVLGFSQGAALAALVVGRCTHDPVDGAPRPSPGFAVLIGGFPSRDPRHAQLYQPPGGIDAPSLHIIGRADAVVPSRVSHDLAGRFRAPVVVEHDGGHVVAATPEVRWAASRFLLDQARLRGAR
jgi:pimeloyl-ACP methyl ester carboxylesterase